MKQNIIITDEMLDKIRDRVCDAMQEKIVDVLRPTIAEIVHQEVGELLDFPLTVHQVAKLTNRTEDNIYKMCQRGKISYTRIGSQVHISLRDINSSLILAHKPEQ